VLVSEPQFETTPAVALWAMVWQVNGTIERMV